MKNLILILVFTFFAHALFIQQAIAFEVKCFWQWGLTSVGVEDTMNPDKKSKPINGEGGYDIFNVNDFSLIKGRKKVKTQLRFGNLGSLPGELFTNGKLDFNMNVGALRGKTIVKYKCDKTSIDVINFHQKKKDVKKINKPKIMKKPIKANSSNYFNTQCDFKFFNAKLNITPDKCIMNIQSFGEPYFTRNKKKTLTLVKIQILLVHLLKMKRVSLLKMTTDQSYISQFYLMIVGRPITAYYLNLGHKIIKLL